MKSKVIFDTLETLPEELRMAISLRELDGMSYEDIAIVMDCLVGTVRIAYLPARGQSIKSSAVAGSLNSYFKKPYI